MVKIRLKRMGANKKPFYRVVVADSRTARNGKFIEEIGYYDPLKEPPIIKIDLERANYWLGEGAQPTDVAKALIKKAETGEGFDPAKAEARKARKKAAEAAANAPVEEAPAEAPAEEAPVEEAPAEEAAE